jgi:hypothetical protein
MPTIRRGRQGGESHLIDPAAATAWLDPRRAATSLGEFFKAQGLPSEGNFLRWIVERHHLFAVDTAAMALCDWVTHPKTASGFGWSHIGLTEEQARDCAIELFLRIRLFLTMGLDVFEQRLEETGADLDQWASLLFGGLIKSQWSSFEDFELPKPLQEMCTERFREKFTKATAALTSKTKKAKAKKRER